MKSDEKAHCIQVRGATFRKTIQSKSRSTSFEPSCCYNLEWGLDLYFSQPELQVQSEKTQLCSISLENKLSILNDHVYQYIHECLSKIEEKDVEDKHTQYYKWMVGSRIDSSHTMTFDDDIETIRALGVEVEALKLIGTNLIPILTGKIDPLQLLLDNNLLRRIYAENIAALQCYQNLIVYLEDLTFKFPNMNVLEIGAGTAGATFPLFEGLDDNGKLPFRQYDFTDISAGFFDDARHLLQKWERQLSFKTLDFSKDPAKQGFDIGTYDLVIAYNALHAASSVDESIANVRKLLKTGGRLILIEITRLEPCVNAMFGLLPGWYMGKSIFNFKVTVSSTNDVVRSKRWSRWCPHLTC